MEVHELNRMFDQLTPTPEQEQEGLDRLLQTERKDRPMKKLKKMTVLGIAAVLLIAAMGAALVGFIGQDMKQRADFILSTKREDTFLITEAEGSPADGWSRMRVEQYWGEPLQEKTYQGNSLSAMGRLWDVGWDLSWLEENYEAVPDTGLVIIQTPIGAENPNYVSFVGAYQGKDGRQFNLQYVYRKGIGKAQSSLFLENYQTYNAADGASVTVVTADNVTWVEFTLSDIRFDMYCNDIEPDELHTILDSLHLSNLTK